MTSSQHVYEVRPRKDHRGVDLALRRARHALRTGVLAAAVDLDGAGARDSLGGWARRAGDGAVLQEARRGAASVINEA